MRHALGMALTIVGLGLVAFCIGVLLWTSKQLTIGVGHGAREVLAIALASGIASLVGGLLVIRSRPREYSHW